MTDVDILRSLGVVAFEPSCVVPPDESEVVRHARPAMAADLAALREQAIARLTYDPHAVQQRERRIALERGRVSQIRRRA
jgi:hypothetical protein